MGIDKYNKYYQKDDPVQEKKEYYNLTVNIHVQIPQHIYSTHKVD